MSIEEEITTHPFEDPDFGRLILLTESTYPGSEIAHPLYLTWEYRQNPDGHAMIRVAEKDSRIIAQYVVIPRSYRIAGKAMKGSLSLNTLTHPDFRGAGLFRKLAEQLYEDCAGAGIGITIGFPNPASFPVFTGRLGFHHAGRVPFYFKPLNSGSLLARMFSGSGGKMGNEIPWKREKAGDGDNHIRYLDVIKDKHLLGDFLNRLNENFQTGTIRSPEYMEWRYHSIPGRNYHLLISTVEDNIEEMIVFRTLFVRGIKCAVLMELLSLSTHAGRKGDLVSYWISRCRQNSIHCCIAAATREVYEMSTLGKHGFFRIPQRLLPQPLDFIFRVHDPALENLIPPNVDDWFLTFGDYDIF